MMNGNISRMMLITAIMLFCLTLEAVAQKDRTSELVEKIIEAYGGRQNVLSVKSYRIEASTRAIIRGEKGIVTRIFEGASRLKVLIRYPSSMEIRILDGDRAVRGYSPGTLSSVEGPLKDSMIMQAARAGIPWILDSLKNGINMSKSKDGHFILDFPIGKGMRMSVFVDPETYLIIKSETKSEGGMQLQFAADYSDFRKVKNVLFPFHEENYASGSHTAATDIEKIIINPGGKDLELPIHK